MAEISQAISGLNMENTSSASKPGELNFALNSQVEGFDKESVIYQSEQANELFLSFPQGMKEIGAKNILELNQTYFMLTNPVTGDSEIGYCNNFEGKYITLISDVNNYEKLGFSINSPIKKIHVKSTNCSVQIYWTDGLNPRRYLDFNDLPWKEIDDPKNDYKKIKLVGQLDVNKMNVQPSFTMPLITPLEETSGGKLKKGTYQFAIQYANSLGDGYTSYYSVTNPLGIFEQIGEGTNKAISLLIEDLDVSGLWDYFNLAVIKTINEITTPYLVGTFPITNSQFKYTYTGTNSTEIALTMEEIFEQFPYYDTAQGSFEIDGIIGWYDLSYNQEINYQQIANSIPVGWETWKIPVNEFEGYKNGVNTANLRGVMRDEVYPLEIYFWFTNGQRTRSFHIPGRASIPTDLSPINNTDSTSIKANPCDVSSIKKRWEVYNTGTLEGYSKQWLEGKQDECYVGPYQYGQNSYWESSELYPNNTDIWGNLSNTPIRHHKLPDSVITHIHDCAPDNTDLRTFKHSIFPIGFKIQDGAVEAAIANSSLSAEQKSKIAGWGIARGNRTGGNKSIIAKGIFNNVGEYSFKQTKTDDEQKFFYSNYPYNDLRPDPYFTKTKLKAHSGYIPSQSLEGFTEQSKERFTFHSPDTHFIQTKGIDSGSIKIETIEYGQSFGHFNKVRDNAKYKFISKDAYKASMGIAVVSGITLGAGTFGWPTLNLAPVPSTFLTAKEMFEKLIPFTNFGYNHTSTGWYGNYYAVPNEGDKIRNIEFGKYLLSGKENVEEGKMFNNYQRETSVYLHTNAPFKYPNEYSHIIPEDNSRYTLSSQSNLYYSFYLFFQEFIAPNGVEITDEDIEAELNPYLAAQGQPIANTIVFTANVLTADIPEVGDIYNNAGNNYIIIDVNISPIDATNSTIIFTCSIPNYNKNTYVPPLTSGTLTLFYATSTSSTSGSSITYTSRILNIITPTTTIPSVSSIHKSISDFRNSSPTIEEYYALLDTGEDVDTIMYHSINNAYQRNLALKDIKFTPNAIKQSNIASYYGSIKAFLPSQWGRIYNYETIDTGYRQLLNKPTSTIFGGDTYINRFALKTKVNIFQDTTFKAPDQADIEYDQIGNYGWPMFWLSTRSEDLNIDIKKEVDKVVDIINNSPVAGGSGSTIAKIWTTIKGIISGGFANAVPVYALILKVFTETIKTVGISNINFDNYKLDGLMETGVFYMYVYGIPYFFVESEVNIDFRQATNSAEGDFYPNVGGGIPDEWLQETVTPIISDNSYHYDYTYSKQNKETFFHHLREDYDRDKVCLYKFPNRAIWAEQSNVEETKNHWLIYRPTARFDLPKSYGPICSLDGVENKQILTRFENRTQIHNALTTINTSQGPNAYLATPTLFSTQPIDMSVTDSGFGGSQHVMLLRTPYGHIYVDSLRGAIILIDGKQLNDISQKGMDKWFKHHLPFNIKSILGVEIDNNFKDIGITGVYDTLYKRVLITKKDYLPLVEGITYNEKGEFIFNGNSVLLTDINYFRDVSWTLSYSFITQSWTSFHSYTPNYYIEHANYFQSNSRGTLSTLWNHNTSYTSYHSYYGTTYPYILEYPIAFKLEDEILQSVRDYTKSLKFYNYNTSTEPKETYYFNKAIIYNEQQCSGVLNLIPKKGLSSYTSYPKYNASSKDIQLTKSDGLYQFNTFWNITKDTNAPIWQASNSFKYTNKDLNLNNLNYESKAFSKAPIRAKNVYIRLIKDNNNNLRLVSRFLIPDSIPSKK